MSDRYTLLEIDGISHVAAIESYLLEDQLTPICATVPPVVVTAPDSAMSIADTMLAIVSVPIARRCEPCWDQTIRLKHPRMTNRIL